MNDRINTIAILRKSKSVYVCNERLLVLALQAPLQHRQRRQLLYSIVAISSIIGVASAFFAWYVRPPYPIVSAILLWLSIAVPLSIGFATTGRVIVSKDANVMYIEWQNVITRRKKKKVLTGLNEIEEIEVKCRVDEDNSPYSSQVYDVIVKSRQGKKCVWLSYSQDAAEAVAAYLRELANAKESA